MKRQISETILRKEIECMIECFSKELFSTFGKKEIIGIYLLGSTNKQWDSEIDYIPGMSDVDLNIYVKNPGKIEKYLANMSNALRFAKNCETNFKKKISHPIHVPRLQAQLHNMFLDKYPEYLAPVSSVKTIYGVSYEKTIPLVKNKSVDYRKNILDYKKYLHSISLRVMSANNSRLTRYLNEIYYNVCSSASQVLCLSGMDSDAVMCFNKTQVIKQLASKGYKLLAKEYTSMLKNSYKYSIDNDSDALFTAILSGYNALRICVKIADKKK